ncbi:MAG TPA: hypothetical protein VMU70_00990 [Candidatus Tyrphobacter sp.]|nr:hypothetical protein [Candidatus Tyrphobacter sp.]
MIQLIDRILNRIGTEKKLIRAKKNTAFSGFLLVLTSSTLLLSLLALEGVFLKSELRELLGAIFANPQIITADWKDLGFFFLENLSVSYLVLFLLTLLVFLQSLKYLSQYWTDVVSFSKILRSETNES